MIICYTSFPFILRYVCACKILYLQCHTMTEMYSWSIISEDPNFLHTSALYAVRSEISLRWIIPEIKKWYDTEYLQIGDLKIFVGYCIMNDHNSTSKMLTLPKGKHHAYVIWLRYWLQQWFLLLPPQRLEIFFEDGHITQKYDHCVLDLQFLEDKEIILDETLSLNRFLEKWQMLLISCT